MTDNSALPDAVTELEWGARDAWWDRGVPARRDTVRAGSRTVVVLAGRSATGRTSLARCLARTYHVAQVDADTIRRGIGVESARFARRYGDRYPVDNAPEPDWLRTLSAASLTSQLLSVELMDQGFDTVTCGLVDVYDRDPRHWRSVLVDLIFPHRVFGVRVVTDEAVRVARLEQRGISSSWQIRDSEGRIDGLPGEDVTGWEDMEIDTTDCSVEESSREIAIAARLECLPRPTMEHRHP